MKLPAIITTDLHLTANPDDEYRWGLFPWLKEQAKENRAKSVAILGDLTDAKDYHSSVLVNRVVKSITSLLEVVPQVLILQGNHDYLKDGHPFFSFLNSIPGVKFITEPWSDTEEELSALWLPHTKNPAKDWNGYTDLSWYSHIFMHQTFKGSVASNGQEMEGEGMEKVNWINEQLVPEIWSGDIHVPQKMKFVEYVGSPYHVHFGDKYDPRAILLERGGRRRDLKFETLSRYSLKCLSIEQLLKTKPRPEDQVKVKLVLDQSSQHEWPQAKQEVMAWAARHKVQLCDLKLEIDKGRRRLSRSDAPARALSQEEAMLEFVKQEDLGASVFEAGLEILES